MPEPIDFLQSPVAEMLAILKTVLQELGIDYFLVGAMARDIQLSRRHDLAAKRKTNDIDIAVLIDVEDDFNALKEALVKTGEFETTAGNPLKLIYRQSLELDLLPFGEIEDEQRMLRLNKEVLLSMQGFREVYPFIQTHTLGSGLTISVCPLEGLVLLKLLSNHENPSRTKDITDIEHFIQVWFELNADEVFENYMVIMNMYDTGRYNYLQLIAARIIGRKIKGLLENTFGGKEHLTAILSKRSVETWQAMLDGLNDK